MKWTVLTLLLTGLVLAADGDKADEAKKDLEKFQGDWKAVSIQRDGESVAPEEELQQLTLIVKGNERLLKVGEEVRSRSTFKLDPTKKPRTIDITVTEGPLKDRTVRGIYELDGDTQKVCLSLEGDGRPKEFTSTPGSGQLLQVFRRQKAKPGDAPAKPAATVANPELQKELLERMKVDQEARKAFGSLPAKQQGADEEAKKAFLALLEKAQAIDKSNTAWMKEVVEKHGWPGNRLVGKDGAQAAWLLVQHADLDRPFQKRCLELLQAAVEKGDVAGQHLAYLTDRVRVGDKQKQLYGTQFRQVDGKLEPFPIEDEEKVDERRKAVGLQPLAEYLKFAAGQSASKPAAEKERKPN